MAFDKAAFEATLGEIEKLLGYLRGNELVLKAFQEMAELQIQLRGTEGYAGFETITLNQHYPRVPCPEPGYAFEPNGFFHIDLNIPVGATDFPAQKAEYISHMKQYLDWAYQEGMAWASGVAGYWRSVCDQFTTPVVSEYSAAIREIGSHVIQPLVGFNSDGIAIPAYGEDWATVGSIAGDWQGDAGNNAETFYKNFSETVTILGNFTRAVNFGCCAVATLVQGTQQSVDKAVQGMRTAVIAQLDEWRDLGRQPDRAPEPPSEMVANITKLGEDVFTIVRDKVPVVGNVVEKVESALTDFEQYKAVGEDVMAVFGVTLEHEKDPDVHLVTADEMYTTLTDILYRVNYQEFVAALEKLQPPPSGTGLPTPGEAGGNQPFTGSAVWDAWNNPNWPPFQQNVGRGSLGVPGH